MYQYHFDQWLCFFYFYCIFGWVFESTYVSLKKRHFVNRGFLKGPWLPLYGSGALVILLTTLPFQHNKIAVYFIGAAAATLLEYVTGVLMVKIFRVRYWDYSNQKFHFQGHICLTSSIAWGGLSLLLIYVIHKPVEKLVLSMSENLISVVTVTVTAVLIFDFALALRQALDLRKTILEFAGAFKDSLEERAGEIKDSLEERAGEIKDSLEERAGEIKDNLEEKKQALLDALEKNGRRLLIHNPGSYFIELKDEAEQIRKRIMEGKKKKDE